MGQISETNRYKYMLVYNKRIADALLNMLHIKYISLYHGEFNYYAVLTIDNGILLFSYKSDHHSHQKVQYLQYHTITL